MGTTAFKEVTKTAFGLDTIKARLNYFELQLHELHWQTFGLGEHMALGSLYNTVFSLKDEIVEKIMGYTGTRTRSMPVAEIMNHAPGLAAQVVSDLVDFAKQLEDFAEANGMCDIENIAQGLSGEAAKTKYLLTLQ